MSATAQPIQALRVRVSPIMATASAATRRAAKALRPPRKLSSRGTATNSTPEKVM